MFPRVNITDISDSELWELKELLNENLLTAEESYLTAISKAKTRGTVNKHGAIISAFIDFLYGNTYNASIYTIKKSEVCSKFYASIQYNFPEFTPVQTTNVVKAFLRFISENYAIEIPVLNKL